MSNIKKKGVKSRKEMKKFKVPHLLWIILGIILMMSILTYVIPAGQFATNEAGKLMGDKFEYVGEQTPVNPWQAAMLIFPGLVGAAPIIMLVIAAGAGMQLALDTGAFDVLMNWSIYKMKDKGATVLVSVLFILMVYLGAFAGTDALIAIVPIGVLFAKKLKLDPIVALGVSLFPSMIGFGTGPTKMIIPQMMMDITVLSGFGARFLSMNFFMIVGLIFVLRYIKKIQNDPSKSVMGNTEWLNASDEGNSDLLKETKLTWRHILVLILFVVQYVLIVYFIAVAPSQALAYYTTIMVVFGIAMGIVGGMSGDEIGNSFAKGASSMAFVGFIIGLAKVVSLVMDSGQITHTIVYTLTKPIMNLNRGIATVGITAIISLINPLIPSATGKAAMLIPIIQPVTEALGLNGQIAVQAFQYGDGFTNLISPALGWTIGSAAIAKVPFDKWVKWVFPKMMFMILVSFVWIYVLYAIGWTGGV